MDVFSRSSKKGLKSNSSGTDLGYRLWDPDSMCQACRLPIVFQTQENALYYLLLLKTEGISVQAVLHGDGEG